MQIDRARLKRIFVRAPNWVGDLVMATASFARIRAAFPSAEIHCGVRPFLRPLVEESGWFDRIVELPRVGPLGFLRQSRMLRAQRYDLAIVLPNSPSTGLMVWLAGVPLRLGYRQGRPGLMNLGRRAERGRRWWQRSGPRRVPKPMPTYYAELLDQLGLPPGGIRPLLRVGPDTRARLQSWLDEHGVPAGAPIALLNAGASYGASKLWEPDRFAAVARHLRARGCTPIFLAGPNEVAMVERIATEAGVLAATRPVLPLDLLVAIVERSALLVTTDAGPRHVALAFDRPIVCLMGPNDPRYTNYCLERTVLIRKELPCSPCQKKVCPLGHRMCMTLITVDEVVAAADRLLATGAP